MERFTISKSEKQTIYEIYKACRLCGAGGGYRMPIIQNIIDLDSSEVELRQKIQECLQLEIRSDDRMPPLICELCVDKVNDFHQFLELTRQTNVKTRTRLGLPILDTKKGDPEQSNCILGVTEPVYTEERQNKKKAGPKCSKIKKEPEVHVKIETASDSSRSSSASSRASRCWRRAASPAPAAAPAPASAPSSAPASAPSSARASKNETPKSKKQTVITKETVKDVPVTKEKKAPPAKKKGELESLLQDSFKYDDNCLLVPRSLKRTREEPPRPAVLPKRAKPVPTKELLKESSPPRRLGPKSKQPAKEPSPPRRPGPKSKQPLREPSPPQAPGPKSKQLVRQPSPPRRAGPKSKQSVKEVSAAYRPGPKSKKAVEEENVPVPVKLLKTKTGGGAKTETPKNKEPPKPPDETALTPGPPYKCLVCEIQCKNSGAFVRHLSVHVPTYTKPTHACNPCGKWFVTTEEAVAHHRYHSAATFPYHCRRCFEDFRILQLYNEHIEKGLCSTDEPSVRCDGCLATFATESLRAAHKCPASVQAPKPGGKCSKCYRTYATAKSLKKHERQCSHKRKGGDLIADPDVLRRLKPMQVRITKCDGLLDQKGGHYDVSRVKPNYGLARNCVYPYMKLPLVKNEPLYRDSMVAIPVALKEEFSFTHWDSDSDIEETIIKTVPSLSYLAIRKLFSKDLLGKVPRKRRKVKSEAFDNENDFDDISNDINDIISSLDDTGNGRLDRRDLTAKIKDIIGCFDSEFSESVELNLNEDDVLSEKDVDKDVKIAEDNLSEINETASNQIKDIIDDSESVDKNVNDVSENDAGKDVKIADDNQSDIKETAPNKIQDIIGDRESVDINVNDVLSENDAGKDMKIADDSLSEIKETASTDNYCDDIGVNENVAADVSQDDMTVVDNGSRIDFESTNDVLESNDNCEESNNDIVTNNEVLESNYLDPAGELSDAVSRLDSETNNTCNSDKIDSLQISNNDGVALDTREPENINGTNHENENGFENDTVISYENTNVDEISKTEEVKEINKDSPIKHSIDNLIGETYKNPEKYINEVISSIEDIIMNTPRSEENGQNEIERDSIADAMHVDENQSDDKITLDDLLPKENRQEELENISDDDFNFDT